LGEGVLKLFFGVRLRLARIFDAGDQDISFVVTEFFGGLVVDAAGAAGTNDHEERGGEADPIRRKERRHENLDSLGGGGFSRIDVGGAGWGSQGSHAAHQPGF
jgi:hypothetical protein